MGAHCPCIGGAGGRGDHRAGVAGLPAAPGSHPQTHSLAAESSRLRCVWRLPDGVPVPSTQVAGGWGLVLQTRASEGGEGGWPAVPGWHCAWRPRLCPSTPEGRGGR